MHKYLAITSYSGGDWVSSPRNHACVFEAENDEKAMQIMASHLKGMKRSLDFLCCIVGGLQTKEVKVNDEILKSASAKLSHQQEKKINMETLFIGESMISQLQPFNSTASKKRLDKKKKKR